MSSLNDPSPPGDPGDDAEVIGDDSIETVAPEPTQKRLGRYELRYEVATGGMATVYLGRAEGPGGFDKLVAVKCILPHLAKDPRFVEMFLDEARIAARISHPNVCPVFDFGKVDGTYFIAMGYLVGEPLAKVKQAVKKSPAVFADARYPAICARIVADACEGLHAAHELADESGRPLGVVHRDVSPQNIFVGYEGTVSVVDFGVAHAAGRVHHTKTGVLKGKLAYMSPEQLHRQKLDRRADVWALGVVLWEMLTMERLFRRDTEIDTILAVERGEIVPPSSVRKGTPAALDAIVMRALDRDRDKRYASARELGRALNQFVTSSGETIGMAEVAEWMAALLPQDRAERMALAQAALRPGAALALPASDGEVDLADRTVSDSRIVERSMPARGSVTPELMQASVPAPRRHVLQWAVLAAAAIGAGVIAVVVSGDQEQQVAVAPSAVAPAVAGGATEAETEAETETVTVTETVTETETEAETVTEAESESVTATAAETGTATETDTGTAAGRRGAKRPRGSRTGAPAVVTGTGIVNVVTPTGWADIYVGGQNRGRTPARLTLPAGSATIELRPYGTGTRIRRRVSVSPDQPARLAVDLPPP